MRGGAFRTSALIAVVLPLPMLKNAPTLRTRELFNMNRFTRAGDRKGYGRLPIYFLLRIGLRKAGIMYWVPPVQTFDAPLGCVEEYET